MRLRWEEIFHSVVESLRVGEIEVGGERLLKISQFSFTFFKESNFP